MEKFSSKGKSSMLMFMNKVFKREVACPSEECLALFNKKFGGSVNVEWFDRGKYFEAIFYKNDIEHIAIFNLSGSLREYRQNLSADYLPPIIMKIVSSKGELMNYVLRNKGNLLEYEIIFRDDKLNRYMAVFSDTGKILEERLL